jgi:hypothetical protein
VRVARKAYNQSKALFLRSCFGGTMKYPTLPTIAAALLAASLVACGGGGAGSTPPAGGGGSGTQNLQAQSETAISATNALGSPMKDIAEDTTTISPQSAGERVESGGNGSCNNYIEFFVPDKNGDPNSTERQFFYDSACTQLARDNVRIFTSTAGSSETVASTVSLYAINNPTPIAIRTDSNTITNATFDNNGFPKAEDGFDRTIASSLTLAGTKTISSASEEVMEPVSGSANSYCGDSAGYNATGFANLGETLGWSAGTSGTGTRTINADGSVTWSVTRAGTTYKGAIGGLAIATGTQNTACPIGTPMFTLTGGSSLGTYSIPISATYASGMLSNLTITGAQLASGNTLNVTTNSALAPTNPLFITGTIATAGSQIATFSVDAFGDGTLTITASGTQYVIDDWHCVK